jgi:malate dehydrogenase (oxaloacetate-decarboxylating)(NADP+)
VYGWSNGSAIFGSGTMFQPVEVHGRTHAPGQVNNFLVFGGIGFAAVRCQASTLPESLFFAAAEAVANALTRDEIAQGRVVPHPARIRVVSLDVATAVVLECQRLGIARRALGATAAEVRAVLEAAMWHPRKEPRSGTGDGAGGADAKEEL